MRTINVSGRSKALNDLLKLARKGDLILESNDGSRFFVTRIKNARSFQIDYDGDDFGEEVEAARQNKELMKFLDKRGKHKPGTGIPLKKVREELKRVKNNK
jgi:hypothetical protein